MSPAILATLKENFPKGTLVRLQRMDDDYAPPVGTLGRVTHVDDTGSIHVKWANGSTLAVLYGVDLCVKVKEK